MAALTARPGTNTQNALPGHRLCQIVQTVGGAALLISALQTTAMCQQPAISTIIDKITIVGAKALTPSAISISAGVQTGDKVTAEALDALKQRLTATGMFGMHHLEDPDEAVRVRMETAGFPKGHGELIIIVDENDVIKSLSITGSGPVSTDEILKHLHTTGVFSSEQLNRDRKAIQAAYNSRGYLASFGQEFGMDLEHPGTLVVPIVVARVQEIQVMGNKITRAFVIRREMKTKEGGYFNRKDLAEDVQRLGRLGIFSDADPQVEVTAADKISVHLKVKETKERTYNFGSSYGGGVLAGFVEVKDNNFRGQDESIGLHIENGVSSNRHAYQVSFSEPYIDRRGTRMQFSAYDNSTSVFANGVSSLGAVGSAGTLVQQKVGGTLFLERALSAGYAVSAGVRAESIRTDPLSLGGSSAALLQDGPLSVVTGTISHSTLDHRIEPRSGALQSYSLSAGHTRLTTASLSPDPVAAEAAGDHTYIRGAIDLQKFISLQNPPKDEKERDNRTTFAMRFQAATTTGTTPFTEQLFLGGATGLRGYRDGRFWGQNMTSGTLELRQPLGNGIKGVLFTEAGDAWGGIYQGVSLQGLPQSAFKLHGSAGLGIRVGTPMGLVRLDYGYGDEGGRVHFGIGYSF